MAFTVSFGPGNGNLVRAVDDWSYVGLRPLVVRRSVYSLPAPKFSRVATVRASKEQETPVKTLGLSIEECEANAVAGKFPDAPPLYRPPGPKGTPNVTPLPLTRRPRRNRKSPALRAAFQETQISPANFVLPLFIHEGEEDVPIGAMPGCFRLGWRHGLIDEVYKARDVGVNSVVLFPKIPDALKTPTGDEAYNDNGLVPRTIRLLKDKYPDIVVYTDVALDPYSSDGHDGIVREDGVIMNDETVHQLCKQAVSQARAGADFVSPSDMMDGRVGAIRASLDAEGFQEVSIMAYTAKYASSFYGPFREALDSNPRFGDKKTYQMNPANYREALIETEADEAEGADMLLVKPAMPYLDVIRLLRDNSALPIAAYQVSGEYSMIKAGGVLKMIDEEKVMMESLLAIRRAGADVILSYFARQAATRLWVSTYSLICATQLAFNSIFSYFINSQKFTHLIFNSVVLLTFSAALLGVRSDTTHAPGENYPVGFVLTLGASATFSLLLSLIQLTFQKVLKTENFSVVLELQVYTSIVASCAVVVGLFASGEWRGLRAEMKGFTEGEVSYMMTLVWTAISWQLSAVGTIGLAFIVSSLFSNVISTVALPVVPIFAVVLFRDSMDGVKVVSMLIAIWGFMSYIYQQYLDDVEIKKARTDEKEVLGTATSI